jgi:mRNA interferase HicA
MKGRKLLQYLQQHGCVLKREGGSHEIQAIPRHNEVSDILARKICRKLSLPHP